MFCDLVGATALSTQLDPEDLRELICSFQARARAAIRTYDGTIAQHLGDGILVYFGYPKAHEDDAVRAGHAALDVVAGVAALNRELAGSGMPQLAVRVGLHTGPVVIGGLGSEDAEAFLAIGETPNKSARLQALAPNDAVVCSSETLHLLSGHFEYSELGVFELKGLTTAQQVFRVTGVLEQRERDMGAHLLVGRDDELRRLDELWSSVTTGVGQCALVRGVAGSGKSKLVQSWCQAPRQRSYRRLHADCLAFRNDSPMHAIRALGRQLFGIEREDDAKTRQSKLEGVLAKQEPPPEDPSAAALLGQLLKFELPKEAAKSLATLSPQVRRQRSIKALLHCLQASAKQRPLIILVEDLHWIDRSSLDVLLQLQAQLPQTSVFLLLTARPEFDRTFENFETITLGALSPDSIVRIVQAALGPVEIGEHKLQAVVDKAEGSPLYAEEFGRMLASRGTAGPERGGRLEIPATLQDSLMARLDQLETEHRSLVQLCAVLGREFPRELVAEVAERIGEGLPDALDRLGSSDLLQSASSHDNSRLSFKHALVQDAAYQSLLRKQRQRYHAQVAEVLEANFPDSAPEVVAHHCHQADRTPAAITHWHRAGQIALAGFSLAECMGHLQRALTELDKIEGSARRQIDLELRLTLGVPLMLTEGFASKKVATNYRRILELCDEVDDQEGEDIRQQKFQAFWGLWTYHTVSGRYRQAQLMGERLLALARSTDQSDIALAAHCALGTAALMMARFDEARGELEAALSIYDERTHAPLAMLLGQDAGAMATSFLTWAHHHLGDTQTAERYADSAQKLCERLAQPSTKAFVGTVLATWDCLRGAFTSAVEHSEQVVGLAEEQGMPHWRAQASITLAWARARLGHAQGSAAPCRASIHELLNIGSRSSMSFYWGGLAEVELAAGDPVAARKALDEALAYQSSSDEAIHTGGLQILSAQLDLQLGRPKAANAALALARDFAETTGATAIADQARHWSENVEPRLP